MAGRRLALLLDAGFGPLVGSARSASRIRRCLERHGFSVVVLRGTEVTREQVRKTVAGLGRQLGEDDSFVLYFVGHGDRARGPRRAVPPGEPPPSSDVLLLVTHDLFDATAAAPGIAGAELLGWLAPLADAVAVTVILDCCHAATMVTGAGVPDASSQQRITEALERSAAGLRTKYGVVAPRDDEGPPIVRLVATTASEIAVERELADGTGRIGLFTDALARVLASGDEGERSWDELLPEIQDIVLADCPTQRPGVEGPRHRVPFTRRERVPVDEHLCVATRGGWILRAGALHGIAVGDRFALGGTVVPVRTAGLDEARLEVAGEVEAPSATRARQVASGRRQVITCPSDPLLPETLTRGLAAAPELVPGAGPGTASLSWASEGLELRDRAGAVVHAEAEALGPGAAARLVAATRRVARWERQEPVIAGLSAAPRIHVAWGRVGEDRALTGDLIELRAGESLWFRAWGTGAEPEVFASLFHRRADYTLAHLCPSLDHGVPVPRSRSVELVARPVTLVWPPSVPRDAPRDEVLLVLVSTRPRALHRVATDPGPGTTEVRTTRSDMDPGMGALVLRYRLVPG